MTYELCRARKCKYYKNCTQKQDPFKNNKLCPGYEDYANQDSVLKKGSQFEITFTDAKINEKTLSDRMPVAFSSVNKSTWSQIVELYFFDRLEPKVISDMLNCSRQWVYFVIRECRILLLERERKRPGRKKKVYGEE